MRWVSLLFATAPVASWQATYTLAQASSGVVTLRRSGLHVYLRFHAPHYLLEPSH